MNPFYSCITGGRVAALALLLAATVPAARAQAPAWQSVFGPSPVTSNRSEVNATATDAAGNLYLVGDFSGAIQLGATTLTSAGGDNVFVAKWSPVSRSFVWAQRLGGTGDDYGQAIAVSGSSVYVGGFFRSSSLGAGSFTLLNSSAPGSGSSDAFLVKFTDAGASASVAWAQQVGGTSTEEIDGLAAVGSSLYVAGSFSSSTVQVGGTTLASAGTSDVFVAKFNDVGAAPSLAWAQRAGGPGFDQADALAVSGGNVYVAGTFEMTATFGTTALTSAAGGQGQPDVFVAKLADAGASAGFGWAVRGGGRSAFVRGLAASGSSVYAVGDFSGPTATFGPATVANAGGQNGNDAFITKLTDAGTTGAFVWAQAGGGSDYDEANAVAVRGGSVYVTGHFASATATFGSTALTNPNPVSGYDIFVARLRDAGPSGSFAWAQSGGSTGSDYARAVALGSTTVYVAGSARTPATFGGQTLNAPVLYATDPVAFVATLSDATGLPIADAAALAGFGLSPNPAHGMVTVQLPAVPGAATATLTVFDALGRAVRIQNAAINSKAELDLAGLAPGLYAMRVAAGGSTTTQRLVVE
ncbi:T9SS type A sorting domain-containing protein [Hymenobacter negativus]|uniref:T9SS type A sorting domain-containing protein n=1 Tax=Hymenobacter negativus TaxID=2795026 RepID=A0ABS0QA73_9BACT|nr:T9SS type A sorting domain-containing protein [Hymenobacter negativus]MBH8559502.1 T9SS type A sorting domain-containing protein [Hymenobacter negativus]